jgi:hypothetical protein
MGDIRNAFRVLVGEPEWKRPLRRRRHKEGNFKLDLTQGVRFWTNSSGSG